MADVFLKNEQQIAVMAEGGKKIAEILSEVLEEVRPGISTLEIDSLIEEKIRKSGGQPSFKFVPGYHHASCVGLNQEVVHSIPKEEKKVALGDLLKIDTGMFWRNFHTDLAWTIEVQDIKHNGQSYQKKFLEAGRKALEEAIKMARTGNRVGHISQRIQEVIQQAGYCPVRILTGHGIGMRLHEEPLVPGVLEGKLSDTPALVAGMVLAIEVIYTAGDGEVVLEKDGWTVCSKDGKIAGLFEKTIAITSNGPLVLTPLYEV